MIASIMQPLPPCFKAYDIRGVYGEALTLDLAKRVAEAYAYLLKPRKIVIGCDVRMTSPLLKEAMTAGFLQAGVDVWDIGQVGTEEVYFAVCHWGSDAVDGGIMITASHNPISDNGIKMVGREAAPIGLDSGLQEMGQLALDPAFEHRGTRQGHYQSVSILEPYIAHLMSYLAEIPSEHSPARRPLTILVNPGNGGAGSVIDALEKAIRNKNIPIVFQKIHEKPDGTFPNGIPNPLLVENRTSTSRAVLSSAADFGVAWDADFDRCFLFDENGDFIEGYYLVGILAGLFLKNHPGEKIIYDPRLVWNTQFQVAQQGGTAIQSRAGHTLMKASMRAHGAIYGGEMSAHHYFRDFGFCDSGMIPWLMMAAHLWFSQVRLSHIVGSQKAAFPCSGEINFHVSHPVALINKLEAYFASEQPAIDRMDGLGLSFENWRFNIRPSNTEPLVRLNIETRADPKLLAEKIHEISSLISEMTKFA